MVMLVVVQPLDTLDAPVKLLHATLNVLPWRAVAGIVMVNDLTPYSPAAQDRVPDVSV